MRKNLMLLAAAAIGLTGTVASAADLPRKAPVYAPPAPPPYSWTGLYVGINGGGHIGHYTNDAFAPNLGDGPDQQSQRTGPGGGVFGGQIGYNWQYAPNFLLGVEGDIQWTGGKDTACIGECGPLSVIGDDFINVETQLKWLATARGRLGWINGDYLWYFTGGAAWGKVDVNVTGFDIDTTSSPVGAVNQSHTKGGWTIGGGVETRLPWQNWTAKLEYLYVDLGTVTTSGIIPLNAVANQVVTVDTKVRENIVRVGLNYKFW